MAHEEVENAWLEADLLAGVAFGPEYFALEPFPLQVESLVNEYSGIRLHLKANDLAWKEAAVWELEGVGGLEAQHIVGRRGTGMR
jgi:hypothetical protein